MNMFASACNQYLQEEERTEESRTSIIPAMKVQFSITDASMYSPASNLVIQGIPLPFEIMLEPATQIFQYDY